MIRDLSKRRQYYAWQKMKSRCLNPQAKDYAYYGGRGIKICENWLKFDGFLADMGPRPSPELSLDRIDNDGNYEPGNCRWATRIEQHGNTRQNVFVIYRGQRMTIASAVRCAGNLVPPYRAYQRLKSGWSIEASVETLSRAMGGRQCQ